MATLFAWIFMAALCCMILGLIKPTLVLRWGKKRTRARAFGWYALFAFLSMLLGTSSMEHPKQQQPQNKPEVVNPEQTTQVKQEQPAPLNKDNGNPIERVVKVDLDGSQTQKTALTGGNTEKDKYLKPYCDFVSDLQAVVHDLDCSMGFDPQHGRKPGDAIVLESDVVGTLTPQTSNQSGQGAVKFFTGTKIKILQRYFYSKECADLLYIVEGIGVRNEFGQIVRGKTQAYVRTSALRLLSDDKRFLDFARRHNESMDSRTAELKKKYIKLLPERIENMAISEDWRKECPSH